MAANRRPARITRQDAEDIAARALLYIAEDGARLGRFLSETGLDPQTLTTRARSPEMLGAVLGHLMNDESALLAFSANAGFAPEDIAKAEAMLGTATPWDST